MIRWRIFQIERGTNLMHSIVAIIAFTQKKKKKMKKETKMLVCHVDLELWNTTSSLLFLQSAFKVLKSYFFHVRMRRWWLWRASRDCFSCLGHVEDNDGSQCWWCLSMFVKVKNPYLRFLICSLRQCWFSMLMVFEHVCEGKKSISQISHL